MKGSSVRACPSRLQIQTRRVPNGVKLCSRRNYRAVICQSTEFDDVPLFSGSTSDLLGGPGASTASRSGLKSIEDELNAINLKSGVRVDYFFQFVQVVGPVLQHRYVRALPRSQICT
jgi:hypothetical protein